MAEQTVVILIHGYNVSDPRRSVGKLRKPFEDLGCLVENYTYGYWPFPWQITKRNPKCAKQVAERVKHWKGKGYRVFVACHSNGAAITRIATMVHRAWIDRVLAIHPALRTNLLVSNTSDRVLVVHNSGDKAVAAGGILGWFSSKLIPDTWTFRPWGKMGQDGYSGKNESHRNVNSGDMSHPVRCRGHSDEFKSGKADYWLPLLANMLVED